MTPVITTMPSPDTSMVEPSAYWPKRSKDGW